MEATVRDKSRRGLTGREGARHGAHDEVSRLSVKTGKKISKCEKAKGNKRYLRRLYVQKLGP